MSSQPGRGRVKKAKALVRGCPNSIAIQGLAPLPAELLTRLFFESLSPVTRTCSSVQLAAKTQGRAGIRKANRFLGKMCSFESKVKPPKEA